MLLNDRRWRILLQSLFGMTNEFFAQRRGGPYRFIQNRPRTFPAALKSDAVAETSQNQLSPDFWGWSILHFC
jgi:hypothetical protein